MPPDSPPPASPGSIPHGGPAPGGAAFAGLPGELPDPEEVRRRIGPFVRKTPLVRSAALSELLGGPVHLKLESLQETGSFKIRGAAAFLTDPDLRAGPAGVVACSSGNHGRAVAHVAGLLGIPASIVVPDWVDPVKLEGIRRAGAAVMSGGDSYDEAELRAHEWARLRGALLVPPFDDPMIVSGQGTLALEILEELPEAVEVVAALSGGGLVGGIGAALRLRAPSVRVGAVSAVRARVMRASLEAGRPVTLPEEPTLAGALAGGIGMDNRWTLPLVARVVDHHTEVEEDEIVRAIRFLHGEGIRAEGGGAVVVAAALAGKLPPVDGPRVLVVSGGNIDPAVLERVLVQTTPATGSA